MQPMENTYSQSSLRGFIKNHEKFQSLNHYPIDYQVVVSSSGFYEVKIVSRTLNKIKLLDTIPTSWNHSK